MKNSPRPKIGIFFLGLTLVCDSAWSQGFGFGDGDSDKSPQSDYRVSPFFEYGMYSGTAGTSLTGLTSLAGGISYKKAVGYLRPEIGLNGMRINGSATLFDTATTFRLFIIGFHLGLGFNLHTEGSLSPFLKFKAQGGRGSLNLTNPPSGLGVFVRPNTYSYGVEIGIDAQSGNRSWLSFGLGYFFEAQIWSSQTLNSQNLKVFLSL